MDKKYISIVIPVYNGQQTIAKLYDKISHEMEKTGAPFEMIFVEDCSLDKSWNVIQELLHAHKNVRGIKLKKNFGQHNALLCGIRAAQGDIIVTMDDDLQNPPEEIPRLIAKLEEGYDVVYGTPQNETHGLLRDLASKITKITLNKAMGADTAGKVSAFRVFRTRLRDAFEQYKSPMVSIDVLLTWGTNKFAAIQVRQDKRPEGQSGYTMRKLVTHAFNMMTGFTTIPLKVASLLGFSLVCLEQVFLPMCLFVI